MPGDYSRSTFNPTKHYSAVLEQQGRVHLDADWNEQVDIQQYRTFTEAIDVIGAAGAPKKTAGFAISLAPDGSNLRIAPGRLYVDGLLCELETGTTYFQQPYFPQADSTYFLPDPPTSPVNSPPTSPPSQPDLLKLQDGTYLVFLDAWQREVNSLDDPGIHEVALGEADTTTRRQTVWQVKLLKVTTDSPSPVTCQTPFREWTLRTAPSTGRLNVQTQKPTSPDPCSLPPTAGYRRLENQLYRVEVQQGGSRLNGTFKWSRDNASVETRILNIDGTVLTVHDLGKDDVLGFSGGQWVELVDDVSALHESPHPLYQIAGIDPALKTITLTASAAAFAKNPNLKLRRWDQQRAELAMNDAPWIDLEDGIQVSFGNGTYRPGDYWLIPARTATGEVEWPPYQPGMPGLEQPPAGVQHHYSRLALIEAKSGLVTVTDCRDLFPSLTDISADDISFNNQNCKLPFAETVQEALDLLCAATDLRTHNKLLHGYGVICGLKVKCGPDRQHVLISPGYALDCEGNTLHQRRNEFFNLVAEAANRNLLDNTGSGQVCLSIAGNGTKGPIFTVEKYSKQNFWESVLEGTLLKDFFDESVAPLLDFVKTQFPTTLTDTAPVPIQQRRLTALINLFAQLINSASGPYGFISGVQKKERNENDCGPNSDPKKDEDQLLWCFFNDLKKLLSSETFCGMFDKDRPFPAYTLDPGLETVFGPALKFHHRLRLHPKQPFAYTCGLSNTIYVYELKTGELVQTLIFPSSTNIKIQDMALSAKGTELYAVGILDNKDSVFAVASITAAGVHTWEASSVKCGSKFVRLAIAANGNLFATALAKGLFRIDAVGTAAFATIQLRAFNATGLLTLSEEGTYAFAAENQFIPIGTETTTFTQINRFDVTNNTPPPVQYALTGTDFGNDILPQKDLLYVSGNQASGQRIVAGFRVPSGAQAFPPIEIPTSSVVRLAPLTTREGVPYLLVALSDKFRMIRIDLRVTKVDTRFQIPVQLFPMSVAIDAKERRGYVLNTFVNTLTTIDIDRVFTDSPRPDFTTIAIEELADYREDAIHAYEDVLKHLLQYLKDRFCEKFLVDCPDCGPEDKIYLGCIDIRDRQVYHICNFTKRQYVKSFRTVEYWLSTVPLLPIAKQLFTKFCCSVLP